MDFHNHFNNTTRAEAERWLSTAVKLLTTRDLHGTKTFAIRARESDPRLGATDQIIAVANTLLAGESRTVNNQPDWYAILQLARRTTHSLDLVATQYRRLALLLNPEANHFPYADQAFRLVSEAWAVLSNPSSKAFYDHQLNIYSRFDSPPPPHPQSHPSGSNQLFERQFMQMHAPPPPQHQPQPLQPPQPQPQPFQDFQQRLAPLEQPQPVHCHSPPLLQRPQPQQPLPLRPQPPPQQPHLPQKQQDQLQQKGPQPQQPIPKRAQPPPPQQSPPPQSPQRQQGPPVRKSPRKKDGRVAAEEETPNLNNVTESSPPPSLPEPTLPSEPIPTTTEPQADSDLGNFWTACPYCYHLFEYSRIYEECMLRCQNCKRAFHAVVIASPPVMDNGEANFCCWAYFPMGISKNNVKETGGSSSWSPFSMMFACPLPGGNSNKKDGRARNTAGVPRVYIDDDADDDVIDISDPSEDSDDEWEQKDKRRKTRVGRTKGKASTSRTPVRASDRLRKGMVSNGGTPGGVSATNGESSKRTSVGTRKRGAAAMGRLDLNVEFSNNEVEEPAAQTMSNGNGTANGEGDDDDTIENIGFFEGLDEFFSSLPILNVADDKVKAN